VKKIRIIIWGFIAFILITWGLGYYSYQRSFNVPATIINRAREYLKTNENIDFKAETFKLNVKKHKLSAIDFELKTPGQKSFATVKEVNVFFASGTGPLDFYHSRVAIEKIVISGLEIDPANIFPRQDKQEFKMPHIPAREILINGLKIKSLPFAIDSAVFRGQILKSGKNLNADLDLGTDFMGGEGRILSVIDLEGGNFKTRLSWKQKSFANFMPFMILSHVYGISISSGSAEISLQLEANLPEILNSSNDERFGKIFEKLKGSVRVKDCNYTWSGLKGVFNARLFKDDNEPWKAKFKNIDHESGILDAEAIWMGNSSNWKDFIASVKGERVKLTVPFFKHLGLNLANTEPGYLDFNGDVIFDADGLTGHGFAEASDWKYQEKKINSASITWQLDSDSLLSLQGNLITELGKLTAASEFYVAGEKNWTGSILGNLQKLDLQSLRPFIESPIVGQCSGPFSVKFDLDNPHETEYHISLNMTGGRFYDFNPEALTAKIYGKGLDWKIENPEAFFDANGYIKLAGEVCREKIAGKISVKNVDLTNFAVPERILTGKANLKAEIKGTLLSPSISGEVWGTELELYGIKTNSIRAQIKFDKSVLTLAPLVIRVAEDSTLDGYFSINLASGDVENIKLNFQKLSLENFINSLPEEFAGNNHSSVIAGSLFYKGSGKRKMWDFSLDGRKIFYKNLEFDSIFVEGSTDGQQGEIKSLFVRAFGGTAQASGQFINNGRFNGLFELENFKLGRIDFLNDYIPGISGELNCHGEMEWSPELKSGIVTMFIKELGIKGRELGNFGAEINVDDKGLRIASGEFDRLGLNFDGEMQWNKMKSYKVEMILNRTDLSFITKAHGISTFDYGGIIVSGNCLVQGDVESGMPDLVDMKIDELRLQKDNDVIVSNRPMQLLYQNESVEIRSLELKYRLGVIGVEGIIAPGKNVALLINGKDFSVKALGRLFDLDKWNYDGSLSVAARVTGPFSDLKINAEAGIDELELAGKKIPSVWAKIEAASNTVFIEDARIRLPSSSFNLKGDIHLSENHAPDRLDLHLFIPEGPVADLAIYFPEVVKQASGTVKADLNITGSANNPQITGDLKVNADSVSFNGMKKPLTAIKFNMSTDDRIISVDEISANLGRGKLSGKGKIDFRDNIGSITAFLSGEKLDLSFLNLEINNASASFDITGDFYNPVVRGDVLVPRGKFNLSTDILARRKKMEFIFDSLDYHININVPRNFWVRSNFLNAEMRGNFSVGGNLEDFVLDGGISCVQGNLFFQQRKFRIDTGEIRFGGVENSLDPYIFVKSEGQIQSTRIFLTLQGNVSSFTPKIYSSPPMSEGDLLAMLTLGRDLNSAMHSDAKDLFENEILEGLKNSYISALIGNTLSAALNLDELFLSSLFDRSSGKTRAFIRVGKYIGRNIFMAYEGTMQSGEEESFIFEYRLPKGFVVNLEFKEPGKEQRIGVRYDWKFW